jgi:hypothetical protein
MNLGDEQQCRRDEGEDLRASLHLVRPEPLLEMSRPGSLRLGLTQPVPRSLGQDPPSPRACVS